MLSVDEDANPDGRMSLVIVLQESSGLMLSKYPARGAPDGGRSAFESLAPTVHALRVIVRDIGGERPHHSDNHHIAAAAAAICIWSCRLALVSGRCPSTRGACGCRQRYPERS